MPKFNSIMKWGLRSAYVGRIKMGRIGCGECTLKACNKKIEILIYLNRDLNEVY